MNALIENYQIEKYPDEPIILLTFLEGFNPFVDMLRLNRAMKVLVEEQGEPQFILGWFRVGNYSLSQFVTSIHYVSRLGNNLKETAEQACLIKQIVWITNNSMYQMAARHMKRSSQIGDVRIPIFDSLDEALHYCRTQFQQQPS